MRGRWCMGTEVVADRVGWFAEKGEGWCSGECLCKVVVVTLQVVRDEAIFGGDIGFKLSFKAVVVI